jgi:hypothetical protein
MANDLLYKASLHLGASPPNKRSSLLYKIPTVGNRQHNTLPTATNIHSLQRLASCGEDYTTAVTPYGPRGLRPNAYVPTTSFGGINTRLLGKN